MSASTVAKSKKGSPETDAAPDDGDDVTTYKTYKRISRILRKIGAYKNLNQEDTLALFERQFDDYLATLQAQDVEARKRRQGE